MEPVRTTRRSNRVVSRMLVVMLLAAGVGACGGGGGDRTVELSIHYRQLPNGGLAAVGTHGLHICQAESDVGRIHVTVESIPPDDTMPDEFVWTCEELSHD